MECASILLILLACFLVYFVYLLRIRNLYWQKRNIKYINSLRASFSPIIGKKTVAENIKEFYDEFPKERYFGFFQFLQPSIFIKDLDLIKKITIKDFEHFSEHMQFIIDSDEDSHNLFSLSGEKWKNMRSTLSPSFTTSKMKMMYTLMSDTAENFVKHLQTSKEKIIEIECKDLYSRYTNDVIATCAFGISCDSLADNENQFYTMGKKVTSFSFLNVLKALFITFFPDVCEYFRIGLFSFKGNDFFKDIIRKTIEKRKKENIIRPDLVNVLLEAKKASSNEEIVESGEENGFAIVEEHEIAKKGKKIKITDEIIVSQAVLFFIAGFESSSTLMSFMSYELAVNQEIQEKLLKEIDEVFKRNGGKVSYVEVQGLKYLDQVVSETLRKYPPSFILDRSCSMDYEIPPSQNGETTLLIEKGCNVTIPVFAIHRDPKYYPEPEKFDPDRFSDENKSAILTGSYIPFGIGPRNCIASRFALLETKTLMVNLLANFQIQPVRKTSIPLKLKNTLTLGAEGDFWIGLEKREIV